jgi:Amt family ammonium transporter
MNSPSETISWVVLAGLLVLLMQGGFILVNSGLCRAKNAGQIAAMNLMVYPITVVAFWVCGFALLTGRIAHQTNPGAMAWIPLAEKGWGAGLFGYRGFLLSGFGGNLAVYQAFFFLSAVVAVAAAIPVGILAERWKFSNFMLYACWAGALPIVIIGDWVWNGGWLSQLGTSLGLGHGFVDFAGSSVIHMAGGAIGLVGAVILGPRIGKYTRDGRPRPVPGHNLVYVIVGTVLLAFGWFGFNLGPALAFSPDRVGVVMINTLLAAATGAVAAYLAVKTKFGKPDPSMLCNGMLAGLAAISGPCAFVNPTASVIIGAVAGLLVVYSVLLFEGKFRVDDPVGAISVHGVSGAWGVLSVGLFADGSFGAGWNGVHLHAKNGAEYGVAGAFGSLFGSPANDWSQLACQTVGMLTCLVFVVIFAYAAFKLSNMIKPMRARREEELGGLDLPETGAECYPDFHLSDKSQTRTD